MERDKIIQLKILTFYTRRQTVWVEARGNILAAVDRQSQAPQVMQKPWQFACNRARFIWILLTLLSGPEPAGRSLQEAPLRFTMENIPAISPFFHICTFFLLARSLPASLRGPYEKGRKHQVPTPYALYANTGVKDDDGNVFAKVDIFQQEELRRRCR